MESHRIAAFRYETLRRDMAEILMLPTTARTDQRTELDRVRHLMDRYANQAPVIGQGLWESLERKYHLSPIDPDRRAEEQSVSVIEARATQ